MSDYYDDPPEPSEEEMSLHERVNEAAKKNPQPVQIALPEWVIESVVGHAAELALKQLTNEARQAVKDAVDGAVSAAASECIREKVAPILDETIKNGWPLTDSYGRPNGTATVQSLVVLELTKQASGSETWIQQQVKHHVGKLVDNAMHAEIKKAQEELRKQLDAVLQAKIAETIRNAVGLK